MITHNYIKQLENHYTEYLRNTILGIAFEPIDLRGGKILPGTTHELHEAVKQFQKHDKAITGKGWTIQWIERFNKKLSKQDWPEKISVTTEEDYLHLLHKESEVERFKSQLTELLAWNIEIRNWLAKKPKIVLNGSDWWKSVTGVVDYLLQNDVSRHYIRSLPVSVHTKFIEENKTILLSILKHLSPLRFPASVDNLTDALQLQRKPYLFAMRWLEDSLAQQYTHGMEVMGITPESLRAVSWQVQEVWLVENETNLYLLPQRAGTLAIFSAGKAVSLLQDIPWLSQIGLRYWGDLDVEGFYILHQLRMLYGHVQSMLMDDATVNYHQNQMRDNTKSRPKCAELKLLPHEEKAFQLIQPNSQIEQEQLNQEYVQKYLFALSYT